MKRIIALFTMLMFLGAGTAMGQLPGLNDSDESSHNVALEVEDWSYIQVLGEGGVYWNVNQLTDDAGWNGEVLGGSYKYTDESQTLRYGTNANSPDKIMVQTTSNPQGVALKLRGHMMEINEHPNTLGSGGTLGDGPEFSNLSTNPHQLVTGINRGGGETNLLYNLYVPAFQSNEVADFETTVTFTIVGN